MNKTEQEAILTVCLMAAFADGAKSDVESAELKRIAQTLPDAEVGWAALYQRVLLRQVDLGQTAASLGSREVRQLAYEMAVCVCEADQRMNEAEASFLAALRRELGLAPQESSQIETEVETMASASPAVPAVLPTINVEPMAPGTPAVEAEVDKQILRYSILNGALELMPESLSTMAIIPLQMKLVYEVGKRYGHTLDRGHIKELLAAAGIGLTSQVVEGYARKLLGGLLGKMGGGLVRAAGKQAASSALAFASTWALGKLAKQYYAGGRQLSAIQLRELFSSLQDQARSLHGRYTGEIQQQSRQVNLAQLLPLARQG